MNNACVALDVTVARLGRAGPHVYITELAGALERLMGDRLRPIASRLAQLIPPRRRMSDRARTLGRDLWWHQIGVTRAARRAGATLLHLPAAVGPVRHTMATVLTIHDLNVLRFPELFRPWFRHYARFVLPRAARAADAVIAVSQATKVDIIEALAIPEQRVVVVPNGVDPCFRPGPAEHDGAQDVRRRFGLPRAFVLTVGAVEPRKNLPRLLQAVARLRARPDTADVVLVHAGPDGWLAGDVSRTVQALNLSSAVRFLGYVPRAELAALYCAARLCAYPALYEGFGLPVAEAMACGCPVVTSNVSSLPEVAGDAALLVDAHSVEEIAAGVAALWTDAARRRELSVKGRVRAACFTWERAALETAALYATVAP